MPNNTGIIQRITGNETINMADDLIIKAAKLLQKYGQTPLGVNISIDKKIPMGAGLGGASSNAATTLLALNKLWQTKLTLTTLKALGRSLGADVPIFLHNHSAYAQGIGDKITNIKLPEYFFLVIYPNVNVNTQQIFNHPKLTYSQKLNKIPDFSDLANTKNDCFNATTASHQEVKEVFDWLREQINKSLNLIDELSKPRMSGTGASVFIMGIHKEKLTSILNTCPNKWHGFIAKGINSMNYS